MSGHRLPLHVPSVASMGPSAFTDGNADTGCPCTCPEWLQWGRRRSPTEIPRASNKGASCSSFNGAVGVHRRKCRVRPLWSPGQRASMGPSAFTDGNFPGRGTATPPCSASMGPSAFTDGNSGGLGGLALAAALQWGRRRSPTEMLLLGLRALLGLRFNGAVGVHRRKLCGWPPSRPRVSLLQWGRRRSPTEIRRGSGRPATRSRLQWGRRRSPTEIGGRPPDCGVRAVASMGPSAFTDGN